MGEKWGYKIGTSEKKTFQKNKSCRKHVFYTFQRSLIIFRKIGFYLIFDHLDLEIFEGRPNRGLSATLRTRCAVSFTARLLILGFLVVYMTLNSSCENIFCIHINGG